MAKEEKILMIVESPHKAKTIKPFLGSNYIVKASVGHITKIADEGLYNLGINVKGDFETKFIVDDGKKKVVSELKDLVKKVDKVILASDEDREGEAIAFHLKNVLDIPDDKYERCTYHEITKKAVLDGLANPRKIDDNLVDAALGRAKLDKIVGYRLSPISRSKVGARSVGRCQSPALRLVVDREKEIINFKPETYYEIYLPFVKDAKDYKAQYKGLIKDKKNSPTLGNKADADLVVSTCNGKPYTVKDIVKSERHISPKEPFVTLTYQQAVSGKFGYDVKKAMNIAQQLYEGINIGGEHKGLFTYLRTDDSSMSPEFLESLKEYVIKTKGAENYIGLRTKKKKKSEEHAQEAHECLRVTDIEMTPDILSRYIEDPAMLKVYEMVYNRTLACVMPDCVIDDTEYVIENNGFKFSYSEHAIREKGFKQVYSYDEEELTDGVNLAKGEKLDAKDLELLEKTTQPPKRYSQTSLVKKLGELNIGRPSTTANIIATLLDPGRGYAEESGKSIAPTEKGMTLAKFLDDHFIDLFNYEYSSKLEENLDLIAKGKLKELDFMKDFYSKLETLIKSTRGAESLKPKAEATGRKCPDCGKELVVRTGRFGKFIACQGWPSCKHTERL